MNSRSLGMATIFSASDMMGFIPDANKDIVKEVELIGDLTDHHVSELRAKYVGRDVDTVIRCHLINEHNTKARYGGVVSIPKGFEQWFQGPSYG